MIFVIIFKFCVWGIFILFKLRYLNFQLSYSMKQNMVGLVFLASTTLLLITQNFVTAEGHQRSLKSILNTKNSNIKPNHLLHKKFDCQSIGRAILLTNSKK
jgi:hypothetical protein